MKFSNGIPSWARSRSGWAPIAILISSAWLLPGYAAADTGLLGYWALDDTAGTVATDSTGLANGLLEGGPLWTTDGRLAGALWFDGVDDRVDLGTPDYGAAPSDSLTIAFWMRADDFAVVDARLFSRAIGVAEQDHAWMVSTINQTGLRFRLKTDGTTTTLVSAAGLLEAGRWHHVAAIYDGLEMRIHLDGLKVAATPKFGAVDTTSSVPLALGNQPAGAGDRPFHGALDDVRVFRRALSQTEVGSLAFPDANDPPHPAFTASPPVGTPPLQVLYDASASYDLDGTIQDFLWDFGDGGSGAGEQVSHTFTGLGNFRVLLTVVDDEMAAAQDSLLVIVSDTPVIDVPFTHEIVDADPPAYTHCKGAADVDGDGLMDGLAAGARQGEGFFWYRNPGWERSTIVPAGVSGFSTDMITGDVDGDGDFDAIIPKGWDYGDTVMWYENPRPLGDPAAGPWTPHEIGAAPAHDVEAGDIDGNGLLDVVVRWGEVNLLLQTAPDVWDIVRINTRDDEGLDLGDMDLDGDVDVVINGYWLENPGPGGDPATDPWPERTIDDTLRTDIRVHVADIDDDGRLDVVFAASESESLSIAWYGAQDPVNGPWTRREIAPRLDFVHSLETGDFDLDGDLDVVAAEMHQSEDPDNVVLYRSEGDGVNWWPQVIATTGSHNMVAADLDADGDIDLFGANHALPPVEVWRNEMNPASQFSLTEWERHVTDPAMPWRAVFLEPAPVDGDGLTDLVAGGWWYRNPGSASGTWVRTDIGLPLRNMAAVYDFDGDGHLDVLGTQGEDYDDNSDFAWARNDGAGGFTIFENVESAVGTFLQGTAVSSFASGGPLQVVLSWQNGTDTQMLTVPAPPDSALWTWAVAADTSLGEGLDVGDIDGDGDLDLLQGIQWLRNDGGSWTKFDMFPPTPPGQPDRVHLIDLNLDGRLDALVSYGHDRPYGSLSWYENPPVATDPWTEHVIDNPYNPQSLDFADLDLDGDVDLVMGEHNRPDPALSELRIYENVDGYGAAWRSRLIYTGDEHHLGARLLDIEHDGDLDIASIGFTHQRLHIYENLASSGGLSAAPDPGPPAVPARLVMGAPYPNPFNPSTRIRYELPVRARVSLNVYDVRGRLVARLVDDDEEPGYHEVRWEPRGLASGVYLAHLRAAGQVRTVRMLLVK